MEKETFQIRIDSILGGISPTTHFSAPDQFRAAIGIDPSLPINDSTVDPTSLVSSGLLRPAVLNELSGGAALAGSAMWIINHPKDVTASFGQVYVYDSVGSVYSIDPSSFDTVTGIGDLNDGGSSSGNGAAYYDNYIYFARATTIARYGPLQNNASPSFTDDYWVGTLGKTALVNTAYSTTFNSSAYPNHVLHRHSDGRLYIADVVDNKGTIHYISTTKTTVEGDTDNGSTYSKLQVGYGLHPMAIESYGSDLAIAFTEKGFRSSRPPRAKIAFWDTTSQNVNQITWVEFPDTIISALKNINGVLYAFSTNGGTGFRITKFVGGYTFQEVGYFEHGYAPLSGGADGTATRLIFGSMSLVPDQGAANQGVGCVYSLGLQKSVLGNGLFCIFPSTRANSGISALKFATNNRFGFDTPVAGTASVSGGYISKLGTDYSNNGINQKFWSQLFRMGRPFKITKYRIPLAQPVSAGMVVTPTIWIDNGTSSTSTRTINATNDNGRSNAVIRPSNLTGENNFWLELSWSGSALCTVALPITIEGEYLDD